MALDICLFLLVWYRFVSLRLLRTCCNSSFCSSPDLARHLCCLSPTFVFCRAMRFLLVIVPYVPSCLCCALRIYAQLQRHVVLFVRCCSYRSGDCTCLNLGWRLFWTVPVSFVSGNQIVLKWLLWTLDYIRWSVLVQRVRAPSLPPL